MTSLLNKLKSMKRLFNKPKVCLTRRQMQVLQLKAEGLTNKEIAFRLSLSEQTVKNHVTLMLDRIGVKNCLSAVAWGIKNKVIK